MRVPGSTRISTPPATPTNSRSPASSTTRTRRPRDCATRRCCGGCRSSLPLLTRTLAAHVERRFTDPRLRQILGYPAVFLGGSPYDVPSLYHLMSHLDLDDGVLYPRGGFIEVIRAVERLALAQGVVIETGAEVARIETADRVGGRQRAVATGVQLADGRRIDADLVVSAADLHHTETALLPPSLQTYPEKWWDTKTPSPGALLLMLGVEGALPQLAHHTLLFTEDWRANFDDIFGRHPRIPQPASLYVCRPSATDPSVAPAGHENLFVLVPVPADPSLGRGGTDGDGDPAVETAADRVIAQISSWCGIPDLAERIVRAPHRRARRLRRRPARVARQRARPRAHPRAERGLPPAQRVAQGRRPLVRGSVGASRHRPADVPHLGRARRQAAARRPVARAAARARESVTCRVSTSRRSS